jgi:hypothetical protein
VGPLGAVSEQRGLWLPRPASGCDGVRVRRTGGGAGAHPQGGGAPVPRRRRSALVASAERTRRANPILRRSRLAAVRGGSLRDYDRRPLGA